MRKVAIILFAFHAAYCCGQDAHLSQFNNSPLNLNPALTGVFDGDYRFVANQRNQWSSISVPYSTYCMAADMRIPLKQTGDHIGAGMQVNSDHAGDVRYKTLQFSLCVSYIKNISADSSQFLSGGLQAGISNKVFVPANATYDSQYDGSAYNAALPSNEVYTTSQITYLDLGTGVNWCWKMKNQNALNIGCSVWHMNKPAQNFYSDDQVKLNPKLQFNCNYSLKLNAAMELIPSLFFSTQGTSHEFVFGGSAKYLLSSAEKTKTAFHIGVFYRLSDAPLAYAGVDYGNFNFGMSYDVNVSGLAVATNNRGAYEFSLIYIIRKFIPKKSSKSLCPVYL